MSGASMDAAIRAAARGGGTAKLDGPEATQGAGGMDAAIRAAAGGRRAAGRETPAAAKPAAIRVPRGPVGDGGPTAPVSMDAAIRAATGGGVSSREINSTIARYGTRR